MTFHEAWHVSHFSIIPLAYLNFILTANLGKKDSVQFNHSVVSNSLQSHESQHARPPWHHQLPEFTQTHIHGVSDVIQPSYPLSSLSPPALNLSQHQGLLQWVFSNESVLQIRWPEYWSFTFSISPSNEYSGLISFRIDWLDLLAVQRTLKILLQHHSSKVTFLVTSMCYHFKFALKGGYILLTLLLLLILWS